MRLYLGGYGHHPSGKMYEYWGNDNYRTGQNVVAPVTNKRSGKTYNTMFTIMRTSGGDGELAANEAQRLSQNGIGIKYIQGTDVLSNLPGGKEYSSKAEWARKSQANYDDEVSSRLMSRSQPINTNRAEQKLLGV